MLRLTKQEGQRRLEEEMLRELPLLHIGRSKPRLIRSLGTHPKGRN
jgi:hypothetical protein